MYKEKSKIFQQIWLEAIFVQSARKYPHSAIQCQGQSILMTTMLEEQMFIATKKKKPF